MRHDSNLQIGPFRLKPGSGLWRYETEIPLPPKEAALLELLVQSRGEVVTHKIIYRHLWPNQLVGYPSLARCVYSLRKALYPLGGELVQTVPKRGYKLAAQLQGGDAQQSPATSSNTEHTQPLARAHFHAGLASASNPGPASLARAAYWFKASTQADPQHSAAHAALAEVQLFMCIRGLMRPRDALRAGLVSCRAALASDPTNVHALGVRGWFQALIQGKPKQGIESIEYARQLAPEFARTYVYLSWIHRALGDPEAALECTTKAVELDPHAVLNRHAHALTLFFSGHNAEALKQESWVMDNYPGDDIAVGYRSVFLASLGRHQEALDSAAHALELARDIPSTRGAIAWCMVICGEVGEARRMIDEAYAAHLPRCPRPLIVPALVALGNVDQAFTLLHEAREERCPWFSGARIDPRLAVLRADKRWGALYRSSSASSFHHCPKQLF
jgi:DNA-binding winged helix-turn-helix (wHTH) protein